MKELSIEEKAKRYDEALKAAIVAHKDEDKHLKATLERIFPELKESEDERIRKEIINYLEPQGDCCGTKERWIAWLEKQGEQKSIDDLTQQEAMDIAVAKCFEQGEQKLNVNDNAKEMFIKALERVEEQNAKGYKLTDCDKNSWWEDFKAYASCIIKQKPAWSEEDEDILNTIINHFKIDIECTDEDDVIRWLKSLKGRYTWKPSKEQMEALWNVYKGGKEQAELATLYNDLKKLKG